MSGLPEHNMSCLGMASNTVTKRLHVVSSLANAPIHEETDEHSAINSTLQLFENTQRLQCYQPLPMETTCQLLGCLSPRVKGVIADKEQVEQAIRADGLGICLLTDLELKGASSRAVNSIFSRNRFSACLGRPPKLLKNQMMVLISLYGRDDIAHLNTSSAFRFSRIPVMERRTGSFERACHLFRMQGDVPGKALAITLELQEFVYNYGMMDKSTTNGFNIFQGHSIPMCQRVLRSNRCSFLHGSIVMAAYTDYLSRLPQLRNGLLEIVDITKLVLHHFDSAALYHYLQMSGGESFDVLQTIRGGDVLIYRAGRFFNDSSGNDAGVSSLDILAHLKQYGPALIKNFTLEQRVMDVAASCSATDLVAPALVDGLHTTPVINWNGASNKHVMVLVGARLVDHEWRLLVQNWWPNMPFVEMSAEYLVSSQADLLFYMCSGFPLRPDIATCNAVYAEADLDGSDAHEW
ncbi:hypothetical protein MPSEU_000554100 [Mayamaea pseudoterrestris]|nr:hypothetical protein MPSEU_000554100 [Mayamaea pseudoterrestris]